MTTTTTTQVTAVDRCRTCGGFVAGAKAGYKTVTLLAPHNCAGRRIEAGDLVHTDRGATLVADLSTPDLVDQYVASKVRAARGEVVADWQHTIHCAVVDTLRGRGVLR